MIYDVSKEVKEIAEIKVEMNLLVREFYKDWFNKEKSCRDDNPKRVDDFVFSASRYKDNLVRLRRFFYKKIWAELDESGSFFGLISRKIISGARRGPAPCSSGSIITACLLCLVGWNCTLDKPGY